MARMNEGYALIADIKEDGSKYTGLLDAEGKITVFPDEIEPADFWISNERLCIRQNNSYGFSNLSGNIVIEPLWDYALSFSDGLALVCKDGLYGFLNPDGEIIIPLEYEEAIPFTGGNTIVSKNGIPDILDINGNSTLTGGSIFDFIFLSDLNRELLCAYVPENDGLFYITNTGNLICPYIAWSDEVYDYIDKGDD